MIQFTLSNSSTLFRLVNIPPEAESELVKAKTWLAKARRGLSTLPPEAFSTITPAEAAAGGAATKQLAGSFHVTLQVLLDKRPVSSDATRGGEWKARGEGRGGEGREGRGLRSAAWERMSLEGRCMLL